MNIQKINFYTRGISFSNCQAIEPTTTQAELQINTQALIDMMQNALKRTKEIEEKAQQIQTRADEVVEKLIETQSKAEEIVAKTIETEVFVQFCKDIRMKELISSPYITTFQLEDGKYDVEITPEKIIATKNNGHTQDIYEIDTETRTLLRCVKGKQKQGPNIFFAEEYLAVLDEKENSTQDKKHLLSKPTTYIYNLNVSRGDNSSVGESFEYDPNYLLSRYSKNCANLPNEKIEQEVFKFTPDRAQTTNKKSSNPSEKNAVVLKKYSRGVKKTHYNETEKEEEFSFNPNGKLGSFRKNIRKTKDSSKEEISATLAGENKFFITANNNSDICPEHSLICYFENNQVSNVSIL